MSAADSSYSKPNQRRVIEVEVTLDGTILRCSEENAESLPALLEGGEINQLDVILRQNSLATINLS